MNTNNQHSTSYPLFNLSKADYSNLQKIILKFNSNDYVCSPILKGLLFELKRTEDAIEFMEDAPKKSIEHNIRKLARLLEPNIKTNFAYEINELCDESYQPKILAQTLADKTELFLGNEKEYKYKINPQKGLTPTLSYDLILKYAPRIFETSTHEMANLIYYALTKSKTEKRLGKQVSTAYPDIWKYAIENTPSYKPIKQKYIYTSNEQKEQTRELLKLWQTEYPTKYKEPKAYDSILAHQKLQEENFYSTKLISLLSLKNELFEKYDINMIKDFVKSLKNPLVTKTFINNYGEYVTKADLDEFRIEKWDFDFIKSVYDLNEKKIKTEMQRIACALMLHHAADKRQALKTFFNNAPLLAENEICFANLKIAKMNEFEISEFVKKYQPFMVTKGILLKKHTLNDLAKIMVKDLPKHTIDKTDIIKPETAEQKVTLANITKRECNMLRQLMQKYQAAPSINKIIIKSLLVEMQKYDSMLKDNPQIYFNSKKMSRYIIPFLNDTMCKHFVVDERLKFPTLLSDEIKTRSSHILNEKNPEARHQTIPHMSLDEILDMTSMLMTADSQELITQYQKEQKKYERTGVASIKHQILRSALTQLKNSWFDPKSERSLDFVLSPNTYIEYSLIDDGQKTDNTSLLLDTAEKVHKRLLKSPTDEYSEINTEASLQQKAYNTILSRAFSTNSKQKLDLEYLKDEILQLKNPLITYHLVQDYPHVFSKKDLEKSGLTGITFEKLNEQFGFMDKSRAYADLQKINMVLLKHPESNKKHCLRNIFLYDNRLSTRSKEYAKLYVSKLSDEELKKYCDKVFPNYYVAGHNYRKHSLPEIVKYAYSKLPKSAISAEEIAQIEANIVDREMLKQKMQQEANYDRINS